MSKVRNKRKSALKVFGAKAYPFFVLVLIAGCIVLSYQTSLLLQRLYWRALPDTSIVKTMYPVAIGKSGRQVLFRFQKSRPKNWVSLKDIPKKAVSAILMSEDGEFFSHNGYSPDGIREALEYNSKPGVKIKRGGSTITQQVVKNLFLSPEKTLIRKARELLLAVDLERKVSKGRILETYLNIAEWGPGIYGIEQASLHYFQKSSANLSPKDAAVLAFMLPNPTRYQHSLRADGLSEFAAKRVDTILDRLWKTGRISDEERVSALDQRIREDSQLPSSTENSDALPSEL